MVLRHWLTRLFPNHSSAARETKKRPVRRRRPCTLRLEALEDRMLPALLLVTSLDDPVGLSAGTLRSAVAQANVDAAHGTADTIGFASNLAGKTIALAQGPVELSGTGALITIDGGSAITVDGQHQGGVVQVDAGVQADLTGLTILNGYNTAQNGGGVLNNGTLTVSNCTISGNSSTAYGGGVYNLGTLTVGNCTISGNSATVLGGGIFNAGTLTVNDSTLSGNSAFQGGGIFNQAKATLNRSTFSGNAATDDGSGAAAGGGVYNAGPLTVDSSTFANNAAFQGGGIYNSIGTASVSRTTVSGNSALIGGGIENTASATLVLQKSILAKNTAAISPDLNGFVAASSGADVAGVGDGTNLVDGQNGNRVGSAANPLDPLLAPLDFYGGPTQTFALLAASPALGRAGSSTTPATDQRGQPRPAGVPLDAGSYQTQGGSPLVTALTDPAAPPGLMSLREAVNVADLDAAAGKSDTIRFGGTLGQGTVALAQGVVEFTGHRGAASITVDGAGRIVVDGQGRGGVFQVDNASQANLTGLTIRGGTRGAGAGIVNGGILAVSACVVSGNKAGFGGGVYNAGTLTVTQTTFDGNSATNGGAIFNQGTLTVSYCTLSNNAAFSGGGIDNSGPLTLLDSTLSRNTAFAGGAVSSSATLTVSGCTISGNSAIIGGGIQSSVLTLTNTIVANNAPPPNARDPLGPDIQGKVSQGSNDLIGVGDGTNLVDGQNGNRVGSAANPLDPLLAPLDFYGGPTQTFALRPGSPALGNGSAVGTVPATDQRGQPRLRNGRLDVGAYQAQGSSLVVTTAADPGRQFGALSLREAIQVAGVDAAGGQSDTITFAPALGRATITLTQGVLELNGSGGAGSIVIDGGRQITVDGQGRAGVFRVDAGTQADLNGLTIQNGLAGAGGGVYNLGTLMVSNCTLTADRAIITINGGPGGGIDNLGTLTVTDSTLSGNSAVNGGGIYNQGKLTVSSSTVTDNAALNNGDDDNSGGGIYNAGTLTLTNTILARNTGPAPDLRGPFTDGGLNLIGGDPLLAPLDVYGGPPPTRALLPGSPAAGHGGAITHLVQAARPGDTVLHVADASTVASTAGHFPVRIGTEQVVVTAVNLTNNTLTVHNPVTAAHPVNDGVFQAADERGIARPSGSIDVGAYQTNRAPLLWAVSTPTYDLVKKLATLTLTLSNPGSNVFAGAFEVLLQNLTTGATLSTATAPLGGAVVKLDTQTAAGVSAIVVPSSVATSVKTGQVLRLTLQFTLSGIVPVTFNVGGCLN